MEKICVKAYLTSLGSLINSHNGSELLIEEFQRPYSWGAPQIETLFKDQFEPLISGKTQQDNPFVGAIVLLPQRKGRTSIVDGQQRLVTLSLIIGFCSKILVENRTSVPIYARRFLNEFRKMPWIKTEQNVNEDSLDISLCSNISSSNTFQKFKQNSTARFLTSANKSSKKATPQQDLIPHAFNEIENQVQQFIAAYFTSHNNKKDKSAAIVALLDYLINKLQMVVVELVSHEQSLAVFEALNAAGQPLSLDQLIKCLILKLFQKYDNKIPSFVNTAWSARVSKGNDSFTFKIKTPQNREQFLIIYCNAFIDTASKRSAYRVLKGHLEELLKQQRPADECIQFIDDMRDFWCFYADSDFELFRFGGEIMIPSIFASRKGLMKLGYSGSKLDEALEKLVFQIESGFARAHFLKIPKALLASASFRLNPKLISARNLNEMMKLISDFYAKLRNGIVKRDEDVIKAISEYIFKGNSKVALLILRRINIGLRSRFSSSTQVGLPVGVKYNLLTAKVYNKNITDKDLLALGYGSGGNADRVTYQKLSQSIGNYLLLIQGQTTGKILVNKPWSVTTKITKRFLESRGKMVSQYAAKVWKI
jgi:hypothetical protein